MFTVPRALPTQITSPVVALLAKLGVTPNMLTGAQLVGGIVAGVVIASGELAWGGVILLASATLDAFDGSLARATGRVTRFGGVLDSTFDRLFEGAVLAGVLYYFVDHAMKTESVVVFVAMVGSLTVSYVRARAGEAGVQIYDGLFTRVVRLLLITFGLIVTGLDVIVWLLAVMTLATVLHRLYAVRMKLRESGEP